MPSLQNLQSIFSFGIFSHLPVSIGIFILQVLSLHNQVKLPCDNFNKYGLVFCIPYYYLMSHVTYLVYVWRLLNINKVQSSKFLLWLSRVEQQCEENFQRIGRNFSMSGHHYLPTHQFFMRSDNVEFLPPIFYAVFWQPFWEWQTSWKFWKHRIAPLMVTYHCVKFYVSIIIHLEVININVRNFNFPIGFYCNPTPFEPLKIWLWPPLQWPPQYRKNSILFDFKGSFCFIF
jgi:hypothetical protein